MIIVSGKGYAIMNVRRLKQILDHYELNEEVVVETDTSEVVEIDSIDEIYIRDYDGGDYPILVIRTRN